MRSWCGRGALPHGVLPACLRVGLPCLAAAFKHPQPCVMTSTTRRSAQAAQRSGQLLPATVSLSRCPLPCWPRYLPLQVRAGVDFHQFELLSESEEEQEDVQQDKQQGSGSGVGQAQSFKAQHSLERVEEAAEEEEAAEAAAVAAAREAGAAAAIEAGAEAGEGPQRGCWSAAAMGGAGGFVARPGQQASILAGGSLASQPPSVCVATLCRAAWK